MRRKTLLLAVLMSCAGCAGEKGSAAAPVQPASSVDETADAPLTERERQSIREQIQAYWIVDIGMSGLETMQAKLDVELNPDGSVRSATIDPSDDNGDPNWKIFAESCRRAVIKSSPLHMPARFPYAAWKRMTLLFNARDLMNP